jgi:hypothetical protein
MTEDEEDESSQGARACRLCGRPLSAAHLYRTHPVQWRNYLQSKISFGMCIFSAVEARVAYYATKIPY